MPRFPTGLPRAAGLLLALHLLFAGCGESSGTLDPPPPTPNQPPVATFSLDPDEGPAPHSVAFDAGSSHDPDGEIVSWQWSFGDGGTDTGETATHVYDAPGYYFPQLTVTDDRGASRTAVGPPVVITAPPGDGDGTIRGVVWHDENGDGERGPDDPPVAGTVVFLDLDGDGLRGPTEPFTVTNGRGEYAFRGVDTGSATTVTQALGFGWTNTFAGTGGSGAPVSSASQHRVPVGGSATVGDTARSGTSMSSAPAIGGISRIIGGTVAGAGDFPFMVALLRAGTASNANAFTCGGTFVAARWVLTAAHCVDEREAADLQVLVETRSLASGGERIPVERVRIFPAYGAASFVGNDVALLELDRPFMVPRSVLQDPARPDLSSPGTTATTVGWGRTSFNGPISTDLRKVSLPLISNSDCQTMLGDDVVDSTICAGQIGTTQSICNGDSGGPLLVAAGDGWIQVGVTSFGVNCQPPLAWARVTSFTTWIRSIVPVEASMSATVDWSTGDTATVDFGNFR